MGTLTKYNALVGELEPYAPSALTIQKAMADKLIALRRNVLGFYAQPDDATELFIRHRVALLFANYGMQQVQSLRAAGADVDYVIPREGALAWLDC